MLQFEHGHYPRGHRHIRCVRTQNERGRCWALRRSPEAKGGRDNRITVIDKKIETCQLSTLFNLHFEARVKAHSLQTSRIKDHQLPTPCGKHRAPTASGALLSETAFFRACCGWCVWLSRRGTAPPNSPNAKTGPAAAASATGSATQKTRPKENLLVSASVPG